MKDNILLNTNKNQNREKIITLVTDNKKINKIDILTKEDISNDEIQEISTNNTSMILLSKSQKLHLQKKSREKNIKDELTLIKIELKDVKEQLEKVTKSSLSSDNLLCDALRDYEKVN